MSLQHRNLADVWTTLQGRNDISNILREIIGQHAVDSTLLEDDSRRAEEAIRTVIWIKTIYDLQRALLTGVSTGLEALPPHVLSGLLPSELLLSSILYLIHVKTTSFPTETTLMTREFTRPRHILAQAVLSGLRLLLLRKENIAAHDKRRLQSAINQAWQHDRLQGVERFIVSDLYAGVIDQLNNDLSRGSPYHREWTAARLPAFAAGLYPLDIRQETFVTSLIHGTMEEDWIEAYWVLFDCLWAVESAVTQRYVDLRRQTSVSVYNNIGTDTDEILDQLYQTRTSLIISIFHVTGPMTPSPPLLESLANTLLDWNDDLDSFFSQQVSDLQRRSSIRPIPSRSPTYRRNLRELNLYFKMGIEGFAEWLSARKSGYQQFSVESTGMSSRDLHETIKEWTTRMATKGSEILTQDLEGSLLPVYIVNCPKLHVVPRKYLEYKLRWCDKWAYEGILDNSPTVNWKEGMQCPSCTTGEKIKFARLVEPFQTLTSALHTPHFDDNSLSQYSVGDSGGSFDATSASLNSRSMSDPESSGISLPSQSTFALSVSSQTSPPGKRTHHQPVQPPSYTESPISPITYLPTIQRSHSQGSSNIEYPVSPLTESLNVPIPMALRFSIDLPIPVDTLSIAENRADSRASSSRSDKSSIRISSPSDSTRSGTSANMKATSRTMRLANSMKRKPTNDKREASPLPKEPCFAFSTSGHSLLLWGKGAGHLVRFDIPSNDITAIQGCKYDVPNIEAAAAGDHKCAIIATDRSQGHRLVIFDGTNLAPGCETSIESSGRARDICLAVSRDDRFVAVSINAQIHIYNLEDGIRAIPFHQQVHVYELRGGNSYRRVIPIGHPTSHDSTKEPERSESTWFGVQAKALSSKEAAEEERRQSAIMSRKLYFSTDSKQLIVATQLGDHCVYIDVWDCTHEPVSTISEHSRSFKLPPWTLNDGDLTSVFYDSMRRNAIVTAFLGKEYPVLVPIPGYDLLPNEQYGTKAVHAAQSPSGQTFVIANAMTEIIQFEYTQKGTLSPRKVKKSLGKISSSVFKPGTIALAMPQENTLQVFWIKDGKCMLRSVKMGGSGETFKDFDIRPHYDRLMSMKDRPIIARAPSLLIPEMDATE